jgi:hypothetical protein
VFDGIHARGAEQNVYALGYSTDVLLGATAGRRYHQAAFVGHLQDGGNLFRRSRRSDQRRLDAVDLNPSIRRSDMRVADNRDQLAFQRNRGRSGRKMGTPLPIFFTCGTRDCMPLQIPGLKPARGSPLKRDWIYFFSLPGYFQPRLSALNPYPF